jgi:hypothetical protein
MAREYCNSSSHMKTGYNSTGSTMHRNLFVAYTQVTGLMTVPSNDDQNVAVLLDECPTAEYGKIMMHGECEIITGTGGLAVGNLVKVKSDGTGIASTVADNKDVAVALGTADEGCLCRIWLTR